jgi:flagellar biosynthesis/type III secretory pathway protein FliH
MPDAGSQSIEKLQYPLSGLGVPSFWEAIPEIGTESKTSAKSSFSEPGNVRPSANELDTSIPTVNGEGEERAFQAGRLQGMDEGRRDKQEEMQSHLKDVETKSIEQVARIAAQIEGERDAFLHSIEHEVVKLALSISARVLRREAEIDPLFLTGAVRVALGQLGATSAVRLRVPVREAELWSETVERQPGLRSVPAIVADEHMHTGEVIIETDVGSVDLGVRSQLAEIARMFEEVSPANASQRPPVGVKQ